MTEEWTTTALPGEQRAEWTVTDIAMATVGGSAAFFLLIAVFVCVLVDRQRGARHQQPIQRCSAGGFVLCALLLMLQTLLCVLIAICYWMPGNFDCDFFDFNVMHWITLHGSTGPVPEAVKYFPGPLAMLTPVKTLATAYYLFGVYLRTDDRRHLALRLLCLVDVLLGSVWIVVAFANMYALPLWVSLQRLDCSIYIVSWWQMSCYLAAIVGMLNFIEVIGIFWLFYRQDAPTMRNGSAASLSTSVSMDRAALYPLVTPEPACSSDTRSPTSRSTRTTQQTQSADAEEEHYPLLSVMPQTLVMQMGDDNKGQKGGAVLQLTSRETASWIAYRLLVNIPVCYSIRPAKGVLKPAESIEVSVKFDGEGVFGRAAQTKEHVLMVQAFRLSTDVSDASAVWTPPLSCPHERWRYTAVSIFFPPLGCTSTSSSKTGTTHLCTQSSHSDPLKRPSLQPHQELNSEPSVPSNGSFHSTPSSSNSH